MTNTYGQVEVRKQRGILVVQGSGQTPRGQKFIKAQQVIDVQDPRDPKFKGSMQAAVLKLFDSGA